jgi:hypothetical protein
MNEVCTMMWFIYILLGKKVKEMAVIYATLIVKGKKTIADVPVKIRAQVQEILIDLDLPELAEMPSDGE